jgi:integrase/recombinase XerD
VVDEIIFRTRSPRDRLMLELMARGGLRVGEVLKITPQDVEDRKITLNDPKSGRESEAALTPQKVAERLKDYIREKEIPSERGVFPITYTAARGW